MANRKGDSLVRPVAYLGWHCEAGPMCAAAEYELELFISIPQAHRGYLAIRRVVFESDTYYDYGLRTSG